MIAAFIFAATVVTYTSSMTEYRNTFCRIVGRSVIALMWISIVLLIFITILY